MIKLRWLCVGIFLLGSSLASAAQSSTLSQEIVPVPEAGQETSKNRVVLRTLDKITARITEFDLAIGEELRFGTLAIVARYCRTTPPIEPPETYAFLEIDDVKRGGTRDRVFEGWMVASSPALNALEHAVYDVWVINCRTSAPDAGSEN